MKKELEMVFEKETKNTYRFTEVETENQIIGTLYVKKSAFDDESPKKVKVILEW